MQEIRMMVKEKSEDDKGSDTLPDEVLLGKLERVESQLQEMNEKVLYLERHATVRPSPPPMFSTTTLKVERKKQPERQTGIPTSAPQKPKAQPLAKKKSKRQSATPAPTSYGSGPPPPPPVRPTMTFYQFINCQFTTTLLGEATDAEVATSLAGILARLETLHDQEMLLVPEVSPVIRITELDDSQISKALNSFGKVATE